LKVISYIDGFNLYHGMKFSSLRRFYWLDLWALSERFLKPDQTLQKVVYCTSRVQGDHGAMARQSTFLNALQAHCPRLEIVYGHFLSKSTTCKLCGKSYPIYEEKKTDVNIACRMLIDAMEGNFDIAFLVSGDSDLVPPVKLIRDKWKKQIVALFPPQRTSEDLRSVCFGNKRISEADLRQSQLPDTVVLTPNKSAIRPESWV